MPILDHFGLIAPFYERLIPLYDANDLLAVLRLSPDMAVLDAGGGTGRIAQVIRRYAKIVVVADVSEMMLAQAKRKPGVYTTRAATEALPFQAAAFDRIVMVDAFHHVCDQYQTAQELFRMLKPGGFLVIQEPDVRRIAVKFVAFAEKAALMRSRLIPPSRIMALFRDTGASVSYRANGFLFYVLVEKLRE